MTKKASAPRTPTQRKQVRGESHASESRLLDPILDAIRKRAGKRGEADAVAFAGTFYQRLSEDELPAHSADAWAALAADFLEFARLRKPGTANVRLFNPVAAKHGWESAHTVLQIVNDDMPFLVDSVMMALAERGIGVHVLGHPILRVSRDKTGRITKVGEGAPESMMSLEIDRLSAADSAAIERAIRDVLADVRGIVEDWPAMRDRMLAIVYDGLRPRS